MGRGILGKAFHFAIPLVSLWGSLACGAEIWVTNQSSNTISVIDADTFKVLATIPSGGGEPHTIAFSPDGRMCSSITSSRPV